MSEEPARASTANRCLHVRLATWDDEPAVGGQGVYVRELRRSLEEAGVRVTTVAGRGRYAVAYRRLTGHGPLDLSVQLSLPNDHLTSGSPDLVHVSGGPGGLQIVRRLATPVVYTAHHTFELSHRWYEPQRWYGAVEARGYKLAQMVIAVSKSTADSVCRMGVSSQRVVVVPPGIDTELFRPGGSRGRRRMLFVGRLEPEKGPLDALAAMEEVVRQSPGASGSIVGSGRLRARVERRVRDTPQIEYRSAPSDQELAELYAAADVVLVPSAFEGVGLVALEAMAAGCAVVGYDVVGLHDTLSHHGVLVAEGDVKGLARTCRCLLEDPARAEELGAAASQAVRAEHSWNDRSDEIVALYRRVIDDDRHD